MNIKKILAEQRQLQLEMEQADDPSHQARESRRKSQMKLWTSYERFIERHDGGVPCWLAAEFLDVTPQAIYEAAERGWITYFQHGRNRLYSRKDLVAYRYNVARKFSDWGYQKPNKSGGSRFQDGES